MDKPMIDYVRERLALAKGDWPVIAKAAGVPYGTLKRIYYDTENDPRLSSVQSLHDFFQNQEAPKVAHQ